MRLIDSTLKRGENIMEPTSQITIAGLIKLLSGLLPSTLGALVSMRFLPTHLNRHEKGFALISAWAVGTYFGRGLAAYLQISNEHISDAILFGFSLFGLAFAGTAMEEIKPLIKAARRKWVGSTSDEVKSGEEK